MVAISTPNTPRFGMPWWVFIITGACWFVVAWIVLALNLRSVEAIAILAGIVIFVAGVAELFNALTSPGWKWLHWLLAILFLLTGVVAMLNPGRTFFWLSAFIGWYLLFKGMLDIILAFATKDANDAWWLGLIIGIVEVGLGFWAAGSFGRSVALLIVFVGAIALTRGITDIVLAFRIRKLTHEERETSFLPPGGVAPA